MILNEQGLRLGAVRDQIVTMRSASSVPRLCHRSGRWSPAATCACQRAGESDTTGRSSSAALNVSALRASR